MSLARAACIIVVGLSGCGYNEVTPAMYETASKKCAGFGGLKSFWVGSKKVFVTCVDGTELIFKI
jgi:hypothetical protein